MPITVNEKIKLSNNKILKISNVLIYKITLKESSDLNTYILHMENYIKSKGAIPIGPIIQKTSYNVNGDGKVDVFISLMRQTNNFIHNVEPPYTMESVIRVRNCMYVRYTGPEDKLKFAYDKINLNAFEEDIELSNESYTIFVDQQDDNIVADVFVEKLSNE